MKLLLVLLLLALAACNSVPMTYAEWKAELARRQAMAKAGVEHKSLQWIREEALRMREAADTVQFDEVVKR